MNDELVTFLTAGVDEDEASAKPASEGPWNDAEVTPQWANFRDQGHLPAHLACVDSAEGSVLFVALPYGLPWAQGTINARHIARHDPARVLREVEAKRAILELCETETDETGGKPLAVRIVHLLAAIYGNDINQGTESEIGTEGDEGR